MFVSMLSLDLSDPDLERERPARGEDMLAMSRNETEAGARQSVAGVFRKREEIRSESRCRVA